MEDWCYHLHNYTLFFKRKYLQAFFYPSYREDWQATQLLHQLIYIFVELVIVTVGNTQMFLCSMFDLPV